MANNPNKPVVTPALAKAIPRIIPIIPTIIHINKPTSDSWIAPFL